MTRKIAKLRVCASCEWIFPFNEKRNVGCPRCFFASYGAHYVYGNKAYRYAKTQKPWYDKHMSRKSYELLGIIHKSNEEKEKCRQTSVLNSLS